MILLPTKQKGHIMSEHSHMPPNLNRPWNFGSWDNRVSHTPPWEYRDFWYHGDAGDILVIRWQYAYDETDRLIIAGDIHRHESEEAAIAQWQSFHGDVDRDNGFGYDGVFIFYGTRHMSDEFIYGQAFPGPLPDNRWY